MLKKLFFIASLVIFAFSLSISPNLLAEEAKAGDISDISLDELLNVEITTAGKKAEKISEIPASVVIINRADIQKFGYQSLKEILEGIPGLFYIDDLGYGGGFGIRGFWTYDARNIVILVNDFKMYEGYFSSYSLSNLNIPPEAIDRIEVIRGPMSVVYGSGAFFGVINIRTNQPSEDKTNSLISLSLGGEKTVRVATRFAKSQGDLKYVLNAGLYNTHGPNVPLSKMGSNPAAWDKLPDNTDGRLEDAYRFFNLSGSYKGFYSDIVYNSRPSEEYFFLPSASKGYQATFDYLNFGTGYKTEISKLFSLDIKFNYGKNTNWREADYYRPNYVGTERVSSTYIDLEADGVFTVGNNLNMVLGLNYNSILNSQNNFTHPEWGYIQLGVGLNDDNTLVTRSVFATVDYKLMENLKIVAGARLEQQPKYDFYFTLGPSSGSSTRVLVTEESVNDKVNLIPRFAAIFSINKDNYLKLMYGQALNRPSILQNGSQLMEGFAPLSSEKISTIELNYIGNFSDKVNLSFSLFHNILKNLMVRTHYLDTDGSYHSFFGNGGKLTTNGCELSLTIVPSKVFKTEISASYQKTKDNREGYEDITVAYSPKFLGYIKASYFITKDITLALTGNYVDKMETYWSGPADPKAGGGRVAKPVDSYFNLGANFRVNNLFAKGFYLNVRGSNLLDKDILYPQYTNNASFFDKGSIGPRLMVVGTLGFEFN